jgi:hypothetical protein
MVQLLLRRNIRQLEPLKPVFGDHFALRWGRLADMQQHEFSDRNDLTAAFHGHVKLELLGIDSGNPSFHVDYLALHDLAQKELVIFEEVDRAVSLLPIGRVKAYLILKAIDRETKDVAEIAVAQMAIIINPFGRNLCSEVKYHGPACC